MRIDESKVMQVVEQVTGGTDSAVFHDNTLVLGSFDVEEAKKVQWELAKALDAAVTMSYNKWVQEYTYEFS